MDVFRQSLIDTLRLTAENEKFLLIRVIGVGNFCEQNSDSALQLAVLERIHSEFNKPPCFYQEPRCTDGETQYLQSNGTNVLTADSLEEVPNQIADAMKSKLIFKSF